MNRFRLIATSVITPLAVLAASPAHAVYWNLFNIEGESTISAAYVTYNSLNDMLHDTNPIDVIEPNALGRGGNIVDGGYDGSRYWNLFNIEGESTISAAYVTYNSLNDMLHDTNPIDVIEPNALGRGANIVGSGYDGARYWNLFNIEGESAISAAYVTYSTLDDMLHDTNAIDVIEPNALGRGVNIVDGGYDGSRYWNLFNIEGESRISAAYVTYNSLDDMLHDTNPVDVIEPNALGRGANIVGSGTDSFPSSVSGAVPEPTTWAMLLVGFGAIGSSMRHRRRTTAVSFG